jgi:hypothetical protein
MARASWQHDDVSRVSLDGAAELHQLDHALAARDDVERRRLTAFGLVIALPLRAEAAERLHLGPHPEKRCKTAQRVEQVIGKHLRVSDSGQHIAVMNKLAREGRTAALT